MSQQKVAFITGGNKGLGLETARQLGKLGIAVVLGSRDLEKGAASARQLKSEGIAAEAVRFDVTQPADYRAVCDYFQQHYGRLDILVNNAGILRESLAAGNQTSSISAEVLHETFRVNFFGVIQLTQTLLPLLRKSPAGRIVNLSSILGSLALHADPNDPLGAKTFAYDASKTALNAFTVHLAHELRGTKIKVNSAHPGWVKTDMGTSAAPLEIPEGARTSVRLATLPDDGPTGGFFHGNNALPW
jgi:NAD(P)-dependent dehydrogenase (short-subunit alcohol dehydrogenase family)